MISTLHDYQEIRRAVLSLPQKERLQIIQDAILTLSADEQPSIRNFDFDAELTELQAAFAQVGPLSNEQIDDARFNYLTEKYGSI